MEQSAQQRAEAILLASGKLTKEDFTLLGIASPSATISKLRKKGLTITADNGTYILESSEKPAPVPTVEVKSPTVEKSIESPVNSSVAEFSPQVTDSYAVEKIIYKGETMLHCWNGRYPSVENLTDYLQGFFYVEFGNRYSQIIIDKRTDKQVKNGMEPDLECNDNQFVVRGYKPSLKLLNSILSVACEAENIDLKKTGYSIKFQVNALPKPNHNDYLVDIVVNDVGKPGRFDDPTEDKTKSWLEQQKIEKEIISSQLEKDPTKFECPYCKKIVEVPTEGYVRVISMCDGVQSPPISCDCKFDKRWYLVFGQEKPIAKLYAAQRKVYSGFCIIDNDIKPTQKSSSKPKLTKNSLKDPLSNTELTTWFANNGTICPYCLDKIVDIQVVDGEGKTGMSSPCNCKGSVGWVFGYKSADSSQITSAYMEMNNRD